MPASIISSLAPEASIMPAFQVYLRLRPPSLASSTNITENERFLTVLPIEDEENVGEEEKLQTTTRPTKVTVHPPSNQNRFRAIETFSFTEVFDEKTDQAEVFHTTALPLVDAVLQEGRDGLLATLGVTGSGKTHTIMGNKLQRGMTQLALNVLFTTIGRNTADVDIEELASRDNSDAELLDMDGFREKIGSQLSHQHSRYATLASRPSLDSQLIDLEDDEEVTYALIMSMYEVYNDRIFDLLVPQTTARRGGLAYKSAKGQRDRKVVAKLRKIHVKDLREALEVLEAGQYNRRNGETGSNDRSSRGHCFVEIQVQKITTGNVEYWSESTLTIVDLAGSERARNAKTAGDRLMEGGHINKSLMCLGQCLQLSTLNAEETCAKPAVIPYRQSKLTELLFTNAYNASGPSQLATMIITADPLGDFNATSQILRYSALARSMVIPRTPVISSGSRQISSSSFVSAVSTLQEDMVNGNSYEENPLTSELVENLKAQLQASEERWQQAEERCLEIEQIVREELAEEMAKRIKSMERQMIAKLDEEQEYQEEHLDRKLDILKSTMTVNQNSSTPSPNAELEGYAKQLEDENLALKEEIRKLKKRVAEDPVTPAKKRTRKIAA